MNEPLPPPIGANRVDEPTPDLEEPEGPAPELRGPSARVRLIGSVVVLALAVVAGVIGYRVISGEDGDGDGGGLGEIPGWNAVAVRDGDSVTLFDESGEELDSFDLPGLGPLTASGQYLLAEGEESLLFVDSSSGETWEIENADDDQALFLEQGSPAFVIGSSVGGNLRLVDPTAGVDVDVGAAARLEDPQMYPQAVSYEPEEAVAVVVDERSFQSIIVPLEAEPEPRFLKGRALATHGDGVLTVQPAGDRADATFYDLAGDESGVVDVGAPRALTMTAPDTALVLEREGALVEITAGATEPREVVSLDVVDEVGPPAFFLSAVDRLVYASADGEVVVTDLEGEEVLRADGRLVSTQAASGDHLACLAITEDEAGADPAAMLPTTLYDVATGDVIGEPFETRALPPMSSSADGCTVAALGAEGAAVLVGPDADPIEVDDGVNGVSPDGTAYVTASDDAVELVRIGEDGVVTLPRGISAFVER